MFLFLPSVFMTRTIVPCVPVLLRVHGLFSELGPVSFSIDFNIVSNHLQSVYSRLVDLLWYVDMDMDLRWLGCLRGCRWHDTYRLQECDVKFHMRVHTLSLRGVRGWCDRMHYLLMRYTMRQPTIL